MQKCTVESRARAPPQQGKSHARRESSKSSRHIAHDGAFGGASACAMTRLMNHHCRARAIVTTAFVAASIAPGARERSSARENMVWVTTRAMAAATASESVTSRCGGASMRRRSTISLTTSSSMISRRDVRARDTAVDIAPSSGADVVDDGVKQWDVNLRAKTKVRSSVRESESRDLSLSAYMRLPVSQYVDVPLPLGATMAKVACDPVRDAPDSLACDPTSRDEAFELVIPGLKFLSLEVQPVIRVRVRCLGDDEVVDTWHGGTWDEQQDRTRPGARPESEKVKMRGPCVLIEIKSARVEGKVVEDLGLNEMFVNRGTTAFRWRSAGDGSLNGGPLTRTGFSDDPEAATAKESDGACIMGWTDIGVGVDPPGAFAVLPRSLTQRVGDTVLGTTLKVLQKVFIDGLAKDYERWAADEDYRMNRSLDLSVDAEN
jgi:hypothetical protein